MKVTIKLQLRNFKIITNHAKHKTTVTESKTPKEFIDWFKRQESEYERYKSEVRKNEGILANMLKPNPEEEARYAKIKSDLGKCNDLKALKQWLLDLHTGNLQKNEKLGGLRLNIKYLESKKKEFNALLNYAKKFLIKAKRLK